MKLKNLVFGIAMFAFLLGAVFAQGENETISGISLNARYEHSVCKVNHAIVTLDAYLTCGNANNVSAGDLSDYRVKLQNDMAALRSATDAKDQEAFKTALKNILEDMKNAAKAIRESFNGQRGSKREIIQCVKNMTADSESNLGTCQRTALARARQQTTDYYRNHTNKFENQNEKLKERGIKSEGSESRIGNAKGLENAIAKAIDSGDSAELYNLRLKFSRNAINFWMEQINSALDYVKEKVESSNNTNKAEVLSEIASIESEVNALGTSCAYSEDVSDPVAYAEKNKECWSSLKEIERELKDLRKLINSGRPGQAANGTEG
ncbi:MAG: hypothetical protein HZA83_01050 [Thaumarchaeota archaeon]|nr:hypothetical protein [Nitrososphaerota archaeon]